MRTLNACLRRSEHRERGTAVLVVANSGETHEQAVERYLARHPGSAGPFVTVLTGLPGSPFDGKAQ